MSRRGPNEGSIRQRKDGRWEARVILTGPDGRRRRRSLLARSQGEARGQLQQALRAETGGVPHAPARLTIGAFLGQWLAEVVQPKVRPSTYRSYEGIDRVHLTPGLGHHQLIRLSPHHVQSFLNAKMNSGLAPRTVLYLRSVLRQTLTQAERGVSSRATSRSSPSHPVSRRPR